MKNEIREVIRNGKISETIFEIAMSLDEHFNIRESTIFKNALSAVEERFQRKLAQRIFAKSPKEPEGQFNINKDLILTFTVRFTSEFNSEEKNEINKMIIQETRETIKEIREELDLFLFHQEISEKLLIHNVKNKIEQSV